MIREWSLNCSTNSLTSVKCQDLLPYALTYKPNFVINLEFKLLLSSKIYHMTSL